MPRQRRLARRRQQRRGARFRKPGQTPPTKRRTQPRRPRPPGRSTPVPLPQQKRLPGQTPPIRASSLPGGYTPPQGMKRAVDVEGGYTPPAQMTTLNKGKPNQPLPGSPGTGPAGGRPQMPDWAAFRDALIRRLGINPNLGPGTQERMTALRQYLMGNNIPLTPQLLAQLDRIGGPNPQNDPLLAILRSYGLGPGGAPAPPGPPKPPPGQTPPIGTPGMPGGPPTGPIPPRPPVVPNPTPNPQPGGGPLGPNPQLPGAPLGAYTDAEYEAQHAMLQRQTRLDYNEILRQLGWDEGGTHMPGEVEIGANRQREDFGRLLDLAKQGAMNQAQGEGNIFSGYYAQNLGQMQDPYVRGLADLEVEVPRQLAQLREQALGTISDYQLQNFALLADAAARRAASMQLQP